MEEAYLPSEISTVLSDADLEEKLLRAGVDMTGQMPRPMLFHWINDQMDAVKVQPPEVSMSTRRCLGLLVMVLQFPLDQFTEETQDGVELRFILREQVGCLREICER
jgi:hypothetical protein